MCATLIAGEHDLTSMLVTGGVEPVERYFAEDAVWSLGDGTRWTKRDAVAILAKAPRMVSSQLVRADVRQFGTVALVLWEERWRSTAAAGERRRIGTDTWMLRGGRWQIIASQEARPAS